MNIKIKIAGAIATGTILVAVFTSGAFAAQSCTITDNGAHSTNKCRIKVERRLKIEQSNIGTVTNTVVVTSSTGGNEAEKNTGGDVTINGGDSTTTVRIINVLNANVVITPSVF